MVRTFSRYWAEPSAELISMRPESAQKLCHHARCAAVSDDSLTVAASPSRLSAVAMAFPPAQCGAATTTRKEPSVLGLKLTWTDSGLATLA